MKTDAAAVYPVYVDESYGPDHPALCVAGYIFEPIKAKQLAVEWSAILASKALPYFHMSSCNGGHGVFSHLDAAERDAVARQVIALTVKYAEYGFCVSIAERAYSEIFPPEMRAKIGTAYSLCLRECLTLTRRWAEGANFNGRFAFFFEGGHQHAGEARRILASYRRDGLAERFRYLSSTFIDKTDAEPLQCADILAWQAYTSYKRRAAGKSPRKDLLALLRKQDMVLELTPQRLVEMAERFVKRVTPLSSSDSSGEELGEAPQEK